MFCLKISLRLLLLLLAKRRGTACGGGDSVYVSSSPPVLRGPSGLLWGDKSPVVANGATVSRRPLTRGGAFKLSHFLRGSARRARGMNGCFCILFFQSPSALLVPLIKEGQSFTWFLSFNYSSSLLRGGGPLAVEEMAFVYSISLPALPYCLWQIGIRFFKMILF